MSQSVKGAFIPFRKLSDYTIWVYDRCQESSIKLLRLGKDSYV